MRKIIIILTQLIVVISFGQINNSNKLQEFTPVNPKAYEFIKNTDVPINKYTGMTNITIPLFNLETKGISLPISLSYNSNGIKVTEEAGCVGMGWALNNNWSIVQQVNGFDDFDSTRREFNRMDIASYIECICSHIGGCPNTPNGNTMLNRCENVTFKIAAGIESFWRGAFLQNGDYYCPFIRTLTSSGVSDSSLDAQNSFFHNFVFGLKDYEPDMFIFNLPGYSGKFVYDFFQNSYTCITDNQIKITADSQFNNPPDFFRITTPDGNLFILNLKEKTTVIQNGFQKELYPSSPNDNTISINGSVSSRVYQVISIETNKSESIKIEYIQTNDVVNTPNISQSIIRYIADDSRVGNGSFPNELSDNITSYTITKQPFSYLSKIIINNNETLNFNYSDRIDLIGSKKLDNIELRKSINGSLVKKFVFSYNYFISHSEGTNTDSFLNQFSTLVTKMPSELTHRLKLLSVTEENSKPYLFDYNTEQLPKKTSLAKDYWGYYNGFLTNNSMFVDINKFREPGGFGLTEFINNVNCSVSNYAQAGILNKITYPTGGFSKLFYELNSFSNVKVPTITQGQSKVINLSTVANPYPNSMSAIIIEGGGNVFSVSGLLSIQGCFPQNPNAISNCYFKAVHFKKELIQYIRNNAALNTSLNNNGLKYVLSVDLDFLDGNPSNVTLYNQFIDDAGSQYIGKTFNVGSGWVTTDEIISNREISISEGIVVFSVSGGCGSYSPTANNNWSQSSFTIKYNDYLPLNSSESFGAGLRIKTILNYTRPDLIDSKKNYTYFGGKLMSNLKYFNNKKIYCYAYYPQNTFQGVIEVAGRKKTLNSNNFIPFSTSASGNYVGYDFIDEFNESISTGHQNQSIGKIREYYSNNTDVTLGDDASGNYSELNLPSFRNNPDNGSLIQKQFFDKDNNLLKEINNTYSFINYSCSHGMKQIFDKTLKYMDGQNIGIFSVYFVGVYPIRSSKTFLINSEEKTIYQGNEIKNTIHYTYDTHNQISKITETNSNGDLLEKNFNYPYDLSTSTNNFMVNRNMLSSEILSYTKINGEQKFLTQTDYKWVGTPNINNYFQNTFAIDKIKYSKSGEYSNLEDVSIFHNYDKYANPTEVSKKGGTRTSFIWGYNGKYPIAKIENTTYSTIESHANNLQTISNSGSEEELITALNGLRNSLPNAMVTTYTYKPLVGVSTITDPKGDKITYFYDSFGRLQTVKDKDGNVLSENQYNYRPN
jgi:YD repeat-containing protein